MNTTTSRALLATLCIAAVAVPTRSIAQAPPGYPGAAPTVVFLTAAQLQDLVGPVAPYPDDLLALILPASTTTLDVVKAQRLLVNGHFIGGFALAAWPAQYGKTGIMSFIVNHYGIVYESDLGPDPAKIAAAMTEYNPTGDWQPVSE